MSQQTGANLWETAEHAREYLNRLSLIPRRGEGEATLVEFIPENAKRILDLGTGAGRLLALLKEARPRAEFVGLDFSQTMLGELQKRFRSDPSVTVVEHNFEHPLPSIGRFDAVISSFAIHHLVHERKRSLYAEVFGILNPAGGFYNLELVSAPSPKLHLQTQLTWLLEIGFADVDCHWEWREFALFGGVK